VLAVTSLALTGALFARDRQNAASASGSRANARQDDLALATLQSLSRTLRLDVALARSGLGRLGLGRLDVHAVESTVVAPLGGTLERLHGEWTLALDGGFACLTWHAGHTTTAARGVCSDNTPLVVAPTISIGQFRAAERRAARMERVAAEAAGLVAVPGAPRASDPVLTAHVAR
jgi:hypothetical protein